MSQRYEIIEKDAGAGGFGLISKCKDSILDRLVAVKTLSPIFKDNPSNADVERFTREAKTLASLSHTNIPAIYDIKIDKNSRTFEIIFEWVEGKNLNEILKSEGPLLIDDIKIIFEDICSALIHSHKKGIIHRDVKPSNLIVSDSTKRACYIVDFGISLNQNDIKRLTSSTGIGTVGYMSPEQENGEELDERADVFSLGVTLYESIAGTKPAIGKYTPLESINSSIPQLIDDLVQQSIQRNKEERVGSVEKFLANFKNAFKPTASFSNILAKGSLSDINNFLSNMNEGDYNNLNKSHKLLIMKKVKGIISLENPGMNNTISQFLSNLIEIAQKSPDEYNVYIKNAIDFGFEASAEKTGFVGDRRLRNRLEDICLEVGESGHTIICKSMKNYLDTITDLEKKENWYLKSLRVIIENLMANQCCNDDHAEYFFNKLEEIEEIKY